jgi:hypothetical protein
VVAAGGHINLSQSDVHNWTDVVAIFAKNYQTAVLCSKGKVMAVGGYSKTRYNVSEWRLFNHVNTIEKEREEQQRLEKNAGLLSKINRWLNRML